MEVVQGNEEKDLQSLAQKRQLLVLSYVNCGFGDRQTDNRKIFKVYLLTVLSSRHIKTNLKMEEFRNKRIC